ncbi:hypothetical protein JWG41_18165 [Leptospira sp. 201903075]|uniref:hypothetical protein n=1 Tax=Leptospira chreensis TaxID=2810035 RepID=UPI001964F0E7|nr:hypothetical protein [Leptospira chreensis]MBM9592374.1 hypothetical protein [Leptospira chreensis]
MSQETDFFKLNVKKEEMLALGIVYTSDLDAERGFTKHNLDPLRIAKEHVLPFKDTIIEILKNKDFKSIARKTNIVKTELKTKLNLEDSDPDFEFLLEKWETFYKKNGADPYCSYDKFLNIHFDGMDILPYESEKPTSIRIDDNDNFTPIDVTYLIRINPKSKTPHSFLLNVKFFNRPMRPLYYLTRYIDHCPAHNLKSGEESWYSEILTNIYEIEPGIHYENPNPFIRYKFLINRINPRKIAETYVTNHAKELKNSFEREDLFVFVRRLGYKFLKFSANQMNEEYNDWEDVRDHKQLYENIHNRILNDSFCGFKDLYKHKIIQIKIQPDNVKLREQNPREEIDRFDFDYLVTFILESKEGKGQKSFPFRIHYGITENRLSSYSIEDILSSDCLRSTVVQ